MLALLFSIIHFLHPLTVIPTIELPDIEHEGHVQEQEKDQDEQSVIIEVEGSPDKQAKQIETYHKGIEVVAIYKTLFQGLALKGEARKLELIKELDFVKGTYPAQTYTTLEQNVIMNRVSLAETIKMLSAHPEATFPGELNNTAFTGKGSKVGVIDTGIDFTHPDLQKNYRGGFDLVDLDEEPMETTVEEGIPTLHGTHVAGIIAANGAMKGVAPDSDLYAYRALGPGGVGTSIHIIAALEEAMNAGMDIVNLSLGNTINGPDYPTSKAVNEAVEQGMAVVVANGNDGPENWTVGAPATAASALSVGAQEHSGKVPVLYEPSEEKEIVLSPLATAPPWVLEKDYPITENVKDSNGKLFMIDQQTEDMREKVEEAQNNKTAGVIVHVSDPTDLAWRAELEEVTLDIPLALLSEKDGNWIKKNGSKATIYYQTKYQETDEQVAAFSSRGPVTMNWMMKPDLIAPGVNIASTVPDGYEMLNGTSMAAPHVAGALSVLKEAHPEWTNKQLIGTLKTTAHGIEKMSPIDQGMGLIDLDKALDTDIIIHDPLLSFGRIHEHINERTVSLTIENISEDPQMFHFNQPKNSEGQTWKLPHPFELASKEKKTIPLTLKLDSMRLDKNIHQGNLELIGEDQTYKLPYVAVGKEEDFPRVMGFQLSLDLVTEDQYKYSLYAAEEMKKITLRLYNPDTLNDEGILLEAENIEAGMNEGTLKKQEISQRGYYYGLIIAEDKQGELHPYETEVMIE